MMICGCVLQGTSGNDGPPGGPGERVSRWYCVNHLQYDDIYTLNLKETSKYCHTGQTLHGSKHNDKIQISISI